jgi:hypothetical protein
VFILSPASGDGIAIAPGLKSYVEFPLPPLMAELDRDRLKGKEVKEGRIEGLRATEYRLDDAASDGVRGAGTIWLSDDNILLRIEGTITRPGHKPMHLAMALSDVKLGPQPPSLFDVPAGLRRIPVEALQALMNLSLKLK